MKKDKILITGGAGCLGMNLVNHFLNQGIEVLVIDNYTTSDKGSLDAFKKVKIIEGSINNQKIVHDAFDNFRPNIVIHSAASYKDPNDWETDCITNILGTLNIAQTSKKFNVSYKEKIANFFFNKSSDMLVKNIDKFEIAKKFKFMINVIKRDYEV